MRTSKKIIQLRKFAKLLDSQFEGPFKIKFGLDGILGFIPGFGDLLTTFGSIYLLIASIRLGCGPSIILRMSLNIALENIIDLVPIFGNVFDIFWKANLKNIDLLEKHLANPKKEAIYSKFIIGFIFLMLLGLVLFSFYISILLFKTIYIFLVN